MNRLAGIIAIVAGGRRNRSRLHQAHHPVSARSGGRGDHQPLFHRGADWHRAYHASKGAVRLMTKNDAITYATEQIQVNSIHSGYIWTPMVNHLRAASDDLEAAKAAAGSVHPIGRMGEPDDIAWAVVCLASNEARFVTGAELAVDGGYTAR